MAHNPTDQIFNQGARIVTVNYDGTYSASYPAGDKPGGEVVAKTITPATPKAEYWTGVNDGETVLLDDGIYDQGLEFTGLTNKGMRAINPGNVTFKGGDAAWTQIVALNGDGCWLDGVRIGQPDNTTSFSCIISNTNNILKNTGCYDGGAYVHAVPLRIAGSGHLIEDVWAWGSGRYTVQALAASNLTFRRVLARWDETLADQNSEPNAAICLYSTTDSIVENCISLDYAAPESAMTYGGDFYCPQHTQTGPSVSNNLFYGCMAINHSVNTSNRRAFRLDPDSTSTGIVLDDFYVRTNGTAIVVKPNCTVTYGAITVSDCIIGTVNTGPSAPDVVPTGPADIEVRYVDGVKTADSLWPWPNQSRIIADLTGADQRRSSNPADTTWQSSTNTSYSDFIVKCGQQGWTIEEYVKGSQ